MQAEFPTSWPSTWPELREEAGYEVIDRYEGSPCCFMNSTAVALLTGLGFEQVSNLKGGMLDWNDQNLPVDRGTPTS